MDCKREKQERRRKGGRVRHETFKKMGCSKKQGQLELSPLNVTQAAGHKARWREETTTTTTTTTKKKKN